MDNLRKGTQDAHFSAGGHCCAGFEDPDNVCRNLTYACRYDEIPPGGAGIDLEQKVRYTGHMDDNGKVVSFDYLRIMPILISMKILILSC